AVTAVPDLSKPQPPPAVLAPVPGQGEIPVYFCCFAQRAEVTDAKDKNLNWVPLLDMSKRYTNALKDMAGWAAQAPEIVHPDYLVPPAVIKQDSPFFAYLTWPLPGMILKNWGFEATHVPQIKLNVSQDAPIVDGQAQPGQEDDTFGGGGGAANPG